MADWRPSCPLPALKKRADVLATIRRFFSARNVLEVETPLLCRAGITDPSLHPFTTFLHQPGGSTGDRLYLQTSPEFAMKRLLAAGCGSIYQICKAFRNEESGRYHNPEFTLLEWYRVGFNLARLIDEIDALLAEICCDDLNLELSERFSYRELFREYVGADPLVASFEELAECSKIRGLPEAGELCGGDRSLWLDLLFSHLVQPSLGRSRIAFVYDYPAFLPSLARKKPDDPLVVERVEIFLEGLELGNGFYELADAVEQAERFDRDLVVRTENGLPLPAKDERLLAALRSGLPDCAGIALGLDRLLMILMRAESIDDVLAFPTARA
ncbi:EF-P lysine aminoacylase EpmA [Methylocaldum sp.]|uniref:EF-P lysine aminoacylase EpmA n=1 Tax=Methylocaldum sp. TaxID=1969727 RepID=UPI002D667A3B|nr:EF-P lysine aminoacylase EpmA [Methylocaldum sp.]HYE35579.1 EF-P lysine aminoacylase EpmA [Methylocaldum sp.]